VQMVRALSATEIARDGVVIIELRGVDSSGNETHVQKIALTGGEVSESALGMTVAPGEILFTNLLESAAIVPTIDYEFRGPTPLVGGAGATFVSSHPDLIAVTRGGVALPLAETGSESVTITVTFPAVDPVVVPVRFDSNKSLVALEFGESPDTEFELPSLNSPYELPPVFGVFDDG